MNSLEQLKDLLIGEEKQQLEQLEQNTASQQVFTKRTSEVLPQAIERISASPEFIASLEGTVTQCVHKSVKKDSKLYADALFPVIGPAIRMSILETFRTLVSSINQAVENSFSVKGLKWRWQAWRAGVPFADYVVSQTIAYRVEQIFLIQPSTGLLMAHAAHPTASQQADADAFSAMLTAIQQFVTDSFSVDSQAHLDSVDFGDLAVMLFASPKAVMAVAVRGIAPPSLKIQLQELLEQVSEKRADALEQFDGDRSNMIFVESMLEPMLVEQKRSQTKAQKRSAALKHKVAAASAIAFFCWIIWSSVSHTVHYYRAHKLADSLAATPGYVINQVTRQSGHWVLTGLRDPIAQKPEQVIESLQLDPEQFDLRLESYLSLDDELVNSRVQSILSPPPTIQMSIVNGVVKLKGEADFPWIQRLSEVRGLELFNLQLDQSEVAESSSSKYNRVAELLTQQQQIRFSMNGPVVQFSGYATQSWINQLPANMAQLQMDFIAEDLISIEQLNISKLVRSIQATQIAFVDQTPSNEQNLQLLAVADQAYQLHKLVSQTGTLMSCVLVGHSDGTGTREANEKMRLQRAQYVDQVLENAGVPQNFCAVAAANDYNLDSESDPGLRKVTFELQQQHSGGSETNRLSDKVTGLVF